MQGNRSPKSLCTQPKNWISLNIGLFNEWQVWSPFQHSPHSLPRILTLKSIPLLRFLSVVRLLYPRYSMHECQSSISSGIAPFFGCLSAEFAIAGGSEVFLNRKTYYPSIRSAYPRISPSCKILDDWSVVRSHISTPLLPSWIVLISLKPRSEAY